MNDRRDSSLGRRGEGRPIPRQVQSARPVPQATGTAGVYRSAAAAGRGPADGGGPAAGGKRKRSRPKRALLFALAAVLLLVGGVAIGGVVLTQRLQGNVARVNGVFDGIPQAARPTKGAAASGSENFLMVGSDSRADGPTTGSNAKSNALTSGDHRTDTIMLLNIPADRGTVTVVSIPRDSWVDIPGHGKNKINAAYAFGGPSLLIQTVEQLTGVRIDHFAVIDFYGFKAIVNAVGGVDISIPSGKNGAPVTTHMNGDAALTYVRERHSLPNGDLDRVKRQQNLIRTVMVKVSAIDPTSNPVQAYKLLDAGTQSISFDSGFTNGEMRSLAFSLRGLQGGASFLTAPVTGTGMEGDQSVVYLNQAKCAELWSSIRNDTLSAYVAAHKSDLLGATTS